MAIERLDLGALSRLDGGRVREAFEQALARCYLDCKDRPGLKDARKVTLTATVLPVMDLDSSELESCDVQFQVTDSQPKRRSKTYNMRAAATGLLFNELSPEDVRQGTIDMSVGPKGVANVG